MVEETFREQITTGVSAFVDIQFEILKRLAAIEEAIKGTPCTGPDCGKPAAPPKPPHPALPSASPVATRGAEILVDPNLGADAPANDDPDSALLDAARKLDGNTPEERTAKAKADVDRRIFLKKELTRLGVPFEKSTRNPTLEKLLADALAAEMPAPQEIPERITKAVEKFQKEIKTTSEAGIDSELEIVSPVIDRGFGYTDEGLAAGLKEISAPATEPTAVEDDPFGADAPTPPPATIDEARVLLTHVSAKFTKDRAFEILHKYGPKLLDLAPPALAALAQECRKELA